MPACQYRIAGRFVVDSGTVVRAKFTLPPSPDAIRDPPAFGLLPHPLAVTQYGRMGMVTFDIVERTGFAAPSIFAGNLHEIVAEMSQMCVAFPGTTTIELVVGAARPEPRVSGQAGPVAHVTFPRLTVNRSLTTSRPNVRPASIWRGPLRPSAFQGAAASS